MIGAKLGGIALFAWSAGPFVRDFPAVNATVAAQIGTLADSALEAKVRAVASELRCPVCQGESIQDSPAALAQEMRAIVREQLAAGRTSDEVKAYFVDKYGEWILLRPRASGWNWMVYILPAVALLVGVTIVMRSARRWATSPGTTVAEERGAKT